MVTPIFVLKVDSIQRERSHGAATRDRSGLPLGRAGFCFGLFQGIENLLPMDRDGQGCFDAELHHIAPHAKNADDDFPVDNDVLILFAGENQHRGRKAEHAQCHGSRDRSLTVAALMRADEPRA